MRTPQKKEPETKEKKDPYWNLQTTACAGIRDKTAERDGIESCQRVKAPRRMGLAEMRSLEKGEPKKKRKRVDLEKVENRIGDKVSNKSPERKFRRIVEVEGASEQVEGDGEGSHKLKGTNVCSAQNGDGKGSHGGAGRKRARREDGSSGAGWRWSEKGRADTKARALELQQKGKSSSCALSVVAGGRNNWRHGCGVENGRAARIFWKERFAGMTK